MPKKSEKYKQKTNLISIPKSHKTLILITVNYILIIKNN